MNETSLRFPKNFINLCDKIIEWTLISLAFLLPLVLNPLGYAKDEISKLMLLHLASPLIMLSWLAKKLIGGGGPDFPELGSI